MRREEKQLRNGLLILALLLGIYSVLLLTDGAGPSGDTVSAVDGEMSAAESTAGSLLLPADGQIRYCRVEGADQAAYTIVRDEQGQYRIADYPEALPVNQAQGENLFRTLAALTVIEEIDLPAGEEGTDLDAYGFSAQLITVIQADQQQLKLSIGKADPSGAGTYVQVNDGPAVLLVAGSLESLINQPVTAFRQAEGLGQWLTGREYPYFDTLTLVAAREVDTLAGREAGQVDDQTVGSEAGLVVSIRPQSEAEMAASLSDWPSSYLLTAPVSWECSDTDVEEFLQALVDLEAELTVAADFPASLAAYGIDENSAAITLRGAGEERRLWLSHRTEAQDWVYLHLDGSDTVLAAPQSAAQFLYLAEDGRWQNLVNPLILMRTIDSLTAIDLELTGENHRLELQHGAEGELTGWLDGREISEKNTRQLYMKLLAIKVDGVLGAAPANLSPAEADYRIMLHKADGSMETLALSHLSDRQLVIHFHDETLPFNSSIAYVNDLAQALAAVRAGEELG